MRRARRQRSEALSGRSDAAPQRPNSPAVAGVRRTLAGAESRDLTLGR